MKFSSSEELNKAVVREFLEHFAAGRADEALRMVSTEVSTEVVGSGLPARTKEDMVHALGRVAATLRSVELTIMSLTAEADRVAAEFSLHVVTRDGDALENGYSAHYTVTRGRIHRVREYIVGLPLASVEVAEIR